MLSSYDYVVIGGGTAGSVLAARLSETRATVMLLEAGPVEPPVDVYAENSFPALLGTSLDWQYPTVPQKGTYDSVHQWPRGKVLGGSSAINAMAHVRGHRTNYDGWAAAGATGWGYDDLLPYFQRSETAPGRDPAYRGMEGPLHVAPPGGRTAGAHFFHQAVKEVGYPSSSDINGRDQVGAFRFDLNAVNGRRQTAADAYLVPAMNRPNLDVVGGAFVYRLRVEGGRCTAVEFALNGELRTVGVAREAVVAAGAIGSPQLLLLSGVGPAEQLRALNIDVVVDLPGVGENLQDHVQSRVLYSAHEPIHTAVNGFCPDVALLRTDHAANAAPDVFLLLIDFPVPPAPSALESMPQLPEFGYTILFSHQLPPESRGSVRLAGNDPELAPLIDPRYYAAESDLKAMIGHLRVARAVGEADALGWWRRSEILPGPSAHSDEQLGTYLRQSSGTAFHPVGTCRIGNDPLGVVDPELRVHGVDGLRVADASVMPEIISANTNATVVAIAERAADLLVAGS